MKVSERNIVHFPKKTYTAMRHTTPVWFGIALLMFGLPLSSLVFAQQRIDSFPHMGVGISNGLRLGWMQFGSSSLGWEAALGWMRMESKRTTSLDADVPTEETLRSDGMAVSAGINYLTHPESEISGMLGLTASHVWVPRPIRNLDQSRTTLSLTFGSFLHLHPNIGCFFRTGPTIHFLSHDEGGQTQFYLHFDAGVGITF